MTPTATSHAYHRRFAQPVDTGTRSFDQPYLLYASEGAFQLETEARAWLLPPHRAALIAAGTPIRVSTTGPATAASVLFDRDVLLLPDGFCEVMRVSPLMREMVLHGLRWDAQSGADAVGQAFFASLAHVAIEAAAQPEQLWFPRSASSALRRAIDYTLAHLDQPLRMEQVAAHAAASPRTLNRRFAEELGMPWLEFVQRARVLRATEQLLMSDASIGAIAHAFGFASASKFAQAFRRLHGSAPAAYRRACLTPAAAPSCP